MPVRIICLGKTRETWIRQGIEEYLKRLSPFWKIRWEELRDVSLKSESSIPKVKQKEADILLKTISETDFVIALDERGKRFNSVDFADYLKPLLENKELVFIIGGVYGLEASVLKRANLCLSFSDFTFPHQLIRLLLIEQLYRSWTILKGKTYHY